MTAAPTLVHVHRAGTVESAHRGHVVIVDDGGEVVASLGDPDLVVFPRSSVKPLQAVGMLAAGLDVRGRLLALAAASHSGEPFHAAGVRELLAMSGLTAAALQCPPDWPYGERARIDHIAAGGGKQSILMNCSGKHSAMLRCCVRNDWPLQTYLQHDHPLQVHLRTQVERMVGFLPAPVSTDGCGAPLWGVPLTGLARAFARLADSDHGREVIAALEAFPEYAGGTDRDVTELNRAVAGLVAKDGAEAVQAMSVEVAGRRYGIALKIADGGQRARPVVAAAALARLGVDPALLAGQLRQPVLGGGQPVGELGPAPHLLEFAQM